MSHASPSTPPLDVSAGPGWCWDSVSCWTVLIRVPLVLNAHDHLDSDLAVDGLTLLDAVHGHWRWHYPGTPYMGILPMLTSYPQALVWGANPITLVSGGTIIWLLVVGSTFWLAARVYGLEVAGWAILPLVFSSLGTIWLSGRITGGHLLTLVWHTGAFAGLYALPDARPVAAGGGARALVRPGALSRRHVPVHPGGDGAGRVALRGSRPDGREPESAWRPCSWSRCWSVSLPREIGRRVDPYDAYPSQFDDDSANARRSGNTRGCWGSIACRG